MQRILYVEDEPDIQRVVKLALEAMGGLTVIACSSGPEAIAQGPGADADLILLDVMMPKMDGPTTLRRLRELPALAATPAVFMTAKVQPDEIAYFKSLGALDVIAKPFDPLTLAQTIRAIWGLAVAGDGAVAAASSEPSAEARFSARMAALTRQFQHELPERLEQLRAQWEQLDQQWSGAAVEALQRSTHNLAGSGATFGYEEITQRARTLDRLLKQLQTEAEPPADSTRRELAHAFVEFETAIRRVVLELRRSVAADPAPAAAITIYCSAGGALPEFGAGYRCEHYADPAALAAAALDAPPALAVIGFDAGFDDALAAGASVRSGGVPVLLLGTASFAQRVAALRAGLTELHAQPLNAALLRAVLQRSGRTVRPARVLLAGIAASARAAGLQQAGLIVNAVPSGAAAWQQLAQSSPDVIVVDARLPDCTAAEFAALLAQDARRVSVQLLLIAENDGAQINQQRIDTVLPATLSAVQFVAIVAARGLRAQALHGGSG